jgi:quercetin dioxygenase-like cupin family protein
MKAKPTQRVSCLAALALLSAQAAGQAIGGAPVARPVQGDPGVYSSRVLDEPGYRTLRNYAEPGATRRLHRHDDVTYHVFILLTGTLRFELAGADPRVVGTGEIVSVPAGADHSFTNIGVDTATFVEVFGTKAE